MSIKCAVAATRSANAAARPASNALDCNHTTCNFSSSQVAQLYIRDLCANNPEILSAVLQL